MPVHDIASTALSRRALFRHSALLAGGAALASLPFGRQLLAHDVAENWPNVAAIPQRKAKSASVSTQVRPPVQRKRQEIPRRGKGRRIGRFQFGRRVYLRPKARR